MSKDIFLPIIMTGLLAGCVIAPGNKMTDPPVKIQNVRIQEITVEYLESAAEEQADNRTLSPGSMTGLQAINSYGTYQNNGAYEYRVGPQDILSVTVWDHPELTIPAGSFRSPEEDGQLVAQNGTIFYPYAGIVNVQGKTVGEIREILERGLSGKIKDPQVAVRVTAFRSQKVFVAGQVTKGEGPLPITDEPLTVVRAIDLAGNVTAGADKTNITLSRDGKYYHINLLTMYENGDLSQNYLLRDGDILYVPDRSLQQVFVMGEVSEPQSLEMYNGRMSLSEALGRVGGANQITSNPGRVFVVRGDSDNPAIYHLDADSPGQLLLANAFPLKPFDVIFVGAAGVTRWNRVISQLLPTANTITNAALSAIAIGQ